MYLTVYIYLIVLKGYFLISDVEKSLQDLVNVICDLPDMIFLLMKTGVHVLNV